MKSLDSKLDLEMQNMSFFKNVCEAFSENALPFRIPGFPLDHPWNTHQILNSYMQSTLKRISSIVIIHMW